MKLYGKLSALVALVVGLPFAAAADPDGTFLQTGGTLWGLESLWKDGKVVSGNGVVVDTGSGSPEVRLDETNRVVGAFTTTRGTMPATGGNFMLSIVNTGFGRTFDFTPQRGDNSTGFVLTTNKLVFANKGNPAEIRIDDGTGGGDGTVRQPFRHFYDVPIALEDELVVRHLFNSTNQYGHYTIGSNNGPAAGVIFARPISGEGKGITIDNAAAKMGVMFAADNTFSGDLVVESGIARAVDTTDRPRAGTPFGVANKVVATNDCSGIDLGGFITGEGQTLVLKGMRTTTSSHTNGVLFSSYGRMDEYAKWTGNVQLVGDTWIGGALSGFSYPRNFYPADADGDLEVSGPISETDGPAAVHVVSSRNVVFSGTNTFSGGLYLDNGYFTARNAESSGTGGIVFNGGVYRAERQSDANVFEMDVAAAPKNLGVHVEAGVTNIVSSNWSGFGKGGFYKYGEGTMLLTNVVSLATGKRGYICGGTVIFDTSKANFVKFGTGQDASSCDIVQLCLNSKIVVRGDPAQQHVGGWYGPIDSGSAVTLRVEDGQIFNAMPVINNDFLCYVNFETDGSGAYFTKGNLSQGDTHKYAGVAPLLIYEGSSFVKVADDKAVPMQDEDYSNTWGGATDCVDVTPTLAAASVQAGTSADVLRFNTPNGGSDLVLTLGGDLTIAGRTILVTPEMGNTTVRITGGKLRSTTVLRILNFNTSAPLIIESDIQGVSDGNLRVVTGGPGKTVLSGSKSFNDRVDVLGGELVTDCAGSLGSGTVSGLVYLCNGGILSFDGTFSPRSNFNLYVRMTGGAIKVPDSSDVVTITKGITLLGGAHFRKLGAGTLKLSGSAVFNRNVDYNCNPNQMHVEYLEGSVESDRNFSEATELTLADNGVTLVGSRWLSAAQGGANGGGNRLEIASKRMLHIGSGGATVDVHGATVSINGGQNYYGFDRCPEFLSGEGELTVVDTDGVAKLRSDGYRDASFRGKFTSYVPFDASVVECNGFELRNAEMHIPSGVTHTFAGIYSDRCNLWFGRLSGFGTLAVSSIKDTRPAYVILGQDDAPDVDFAGTLTLTYGDNDQAYPQLVKVGNNAQRISGSANLLDGNTIVRTGSLLAGNNSPATSGASGAFGAAMVFVGDENTPEGASPAFLIDGAYTVANEVRVPDTSPASAVPVLGGTSNANGAVFSGPISLRRDVAFMAGDGATVTFTGPITGLQGVSMRGGGRVRIESDVSIGGDFAWTGGTLEVTGSVTVPEGATLTFDESLCTKENRDKVFEMLYAAGGINGSFQCPQGIPAYWRLVQGSHKITLAAQNGFMLFVR